MNDLKSHAEHRGVHGLLVAVVTAYAIWASLAWRGALTESPGLLALLAAGAVLAARLTSLDLSGRSPRFAMTFVLTTFALFPSPAGLIMGAAAALAARGGGVAGVYRSGAPALAPVLIALTLAQVLSAAWFAVSRAPSVTLVGLTLAFLVTQFAAYAVSTVLGIVRRDAALTGPRLRWRPPVIELLNIPLAWLLAATVTRGAWLQAVGVAGLALFVGWCLLRLGHALRDLRRTGDALALRLSELGTLHAIAREILSTLDPAQVLTIVERECSKIFDVDTCTIAMRNADDSTLSAVLRRRRGEPADCTTVTLGPGLANAVASSKRSVWLADCATLPVDSPFRGEAVAPGTRAAMAVPLIVEERVIGVIVLESRTRDAYDDHQLSVLTTIAQQAAVAIENARNYERATVDSLTGFHSREVFFQRVEEEHSRVRRYGGKFALLMLDLDGFKVINDRYGHLAGDQYLKSIAATVRQQLRDADLSCRYGGDEFCVLLPETELPGAKIIAERIRDAVSSRVVGSEGQVLRTTISVGVAVFPDHDPGQLLGLLRNADEALYRAKRAGRNCVVPFAA